LSYGGIHHDFTTERLGKQALYKLPTKLSTFITTESLVPSLQLLAPRGERGIIADCRHDAPFVTDNRV